MTGPREQQQHAPADRRWRFGRAVLDERTLELHVDGQPVEVERKSLQVLMHLLNHAGEVVTKDELLAAVWPGRILSDSVITSCMARLRDALRDDDQGVIKTVHGFGYRLIAPVDVEASPGSVPARFEFKLGEHLPARPLWSLVERLGTGGHGEAWLARHDKTHERRVYKFAANEETLATLKREITIYRFLHDSLGDRPDLVHLLDWNLEEPPYFLEYDYLEAGSLTTWAKTQGGLDRVPLETRIELAAQVADALGAAHSVGVLHKDLKPSNVLIDRRDGGVPQIRLCDFGSGGVLDVQRLEQMGITRLGFTQTVGSFQAAGATPLYLAPEVAAGQPFTVKADVYALGVMLYQLAVGNFHKALAPGWEQDVPDEVLRQDIAAAADGHPELRLGDAARLAHRLRTLEPRRRALEDERRAKAEAESAKLQMERMRARRLWVRLALAALLAGVALSTALYVDARRARDAAAAAAAESRAVTAFLSQDMLAQIGSDQRPLKDLTLKEVLDGASAQVAKRFGDRPQTAAQVHLALGASYVALDDAAAAERELDRALSLALEHEEPGSDPALAAVAGLLIVKTALGKLPAMRPIYDAVLADGISRLGATDPRVLALRQQFAYIRTYSGEHQTAAAELRLIISEATAQPTADPSFIADSASKLGLILLKLGEYAEAEKVLRTATEQLVTQLGLNHVRVAEARVELGRALTALARYEEADREFGLALQVAENWAPSSSARYVLDVRRRRGELWFEQGRLSDAAAALESVRDSYASWPGPERDWSFLARAPLAAVYQRQGLLARAVAEAKAALGGAEQALGPSHPDLPAFRIGLADILRELGDVAGAREQLDRIDRAAMAQLPAQHPYHAELLRLDGLLLLSDRKYDAARAALSEARTRYEQRLGPEHWRARRARAELARLDRRT